jgi:FixJ family two-component response regulator/Txe/YoeB family toxin of Txe-Axe toxin-antitoxin module
MANIIILDDEKSITSEFSGYSQAMGHIAYECQTREDVLDTIDALHEKKEKVDLFILDHDLGEGDTSLKLLRILNKYDYMDYQNRFIVATGHALVNITKDYAKFGSMGHLIKPIHQSQFNHTVTHALSRIEYFNNQEENWESAYELLEDMKIIDSIDELTTNNIKINEQYLALNDIYNKLVSEIKDKQGEDIVKAYEAASESVNNIKGGFGIIYDYSNGMTFTPKFLEDSEFFYNKDRMLFFRLLSYLKRIGDSPLDYRVKKLNGAGENSYEYRVGRDYRLYFSRHEESLQLERFAHKNVQDNIIKSLANS